MALKVTAGMDEHSLTMGVFLDVVPRSDQVVSGYSDATIDSGVLKPHRCTT
jgi:hypothetical protein